MRSKKPRPMRIVPDDSDENALVLPDGDSQNSAPGLDAAAEQAPPPNPSDATQSEKPADSGSGSPGADLELPDQPSALHETYKAVSTADPDKSAKIIQAADKTGLDDAYVAKNLPQVEKAQAAPPVSLFSRIEAEYPGTSKFLSNPRNMAIAHDDLPNLAAHEDVVQKLEQAETVDNSYNPINLAKTALAGFQLSTGALIARQKLPSYTLGEAPDTAHRLLSGLGTVVGDIPIWAMAAKVGGEVGAAGGATTGGAIGAGIGSVVPGVGTFAGAATGTTVGGLLGGLSGAGAAGFGTVAFVRQALLDDFRRGKIRSNEDLKERVENAFKEGLKQAAVGIPTQLVGGGVGGLVAEATNPLVKTLAPMVAENATMTTAQAGIEGRAPTWQEALDNSLLVMGMHLTNHIAATTLSSAPELASHVKDAYEAAKSDQVLGAYDAMGKLAESSKLRERAPETHAAHVSELLNETGAENVFIPVEAFQQYFQSKNIDPEAVVDELGVTKAYDEARATGGDIQIPYATWIEKTAGTEHYRGLAQDVKFDPEDLTARQVDQKREETKSKVQAEEAKAQAEIEAQDQADQKAAETQSQIESVAKIYQDMQEQLKAAGLSTDEASNNPHVAASFFKTMADKLGVDPYELYKKFGLTVEKREAPIGVDEAQSGSAAQFGTHYDYQPEILSRIKDEIASSEYEPGGLKMDEDGNVTGRFGATSTAPEYFKNSGYKKAEAVKAIDKQLKGEKLTDRQRSIIKDLYGSSGYDKSFLDPSALDWLSQEGITELNQGPVRLTSTGRVLGVVDPEAAAKGEKAVQKELNKSAKEQGLFEAEADKAQPEPSFADRARARFGDEPFADKMFEKAKKQAEKSNQPYAPLMNGKKQLGVFPNENATPSGVIGDPAKFVSGDPAKIFRDAEQLNWVDHKYGLTKKLIAEHAAQGIPLEITTSSDLISHDDYVSALPKDAKVNIVLPIRGEERAMNDPLPSEKRLLIAYDKLRQDGVDVRVSRPDPEAKTLNPIDPFTLKRLQSENNAYWVRKDEVSYDQSANDSVASLYGESIAKRDEVDQTTHAPRDAVPVLEFKEHEPITGKLTAENVKGQLEKIAATGEFKNDHTGQTIEISQDTVDKAISHASKVIREKQSRTMQRAFLESLQHMDEIVRNAEFMTTAEERKGRDTEQWQYYFSPFKMDGKDYLAKLEVKKSGEKLELHNYALVDPRGLADLPAPNAGEGASTLPAGEIPIDKFAQLVKASRDKYSYFQDNESPRGRIRFGSKNQFSIDLFEKADKSTYLHEMGHYFLEIMGRVTSEEGAPEQIKKDYDTLLKWFGVSSKDQITTEHHEKFARGFESYLMEGKAPTEALQSAFDKFRSWLVSIYREFKNLNVNLTDDVRGVMDRMLASEEEIEAAKKKVQITDEVIPEAAPEAKAKIRTLQERARDIAESQLLREQMKELDEKHKQFLIEERERQTEKALDEVSQEPVFKAGDDLRADPEFLKFKDPADIADTFLSEKLTDQQTAKFEALAEIHGFGSGEEMAQEMILARETKAFQNEVSRRVEEAMAPHADLRTTPRIKEEAMKAIHNEKMTELLALEREVLLDLVHEKSVKEEVSKRRRIEAKIEAEAARDEARRILGDKPVKDAGNAKIYITAERNAAVKAAKALAKGDHEAAAEAKRQQMLNHALASEAIKNKAEAEKAIKFIEKFSDRKGDLGKMPYGFARQLDSLLSRFGLAEAKPEDQATLEKIAVKMAQEGAAPDAIANATGLKQDQAGKWVPESLSDFVTRVNENYYGISLPDSVTSGGAKKPGDLTLSQLRDIKEAVSAVATTGKNFNRFLNDFIKADIQEAAAQLRASIEETVGTPFADDLRIGSKHPSKAAEKIADILALPSNITPYLTNVLTVCRFLDGGKDNGPATEYIYRTLKRAEDSKLARYEKAVGEINALFEKHYDPKEIAGYKDKRYYFDSIGRHLTREEILSMALNWGNEGNRDRIRRGFNLEDAQVGQILDKLDKKDWDFVQGVWDHLDSYWPDVAALEMKVRGIEPAKVPSAAVETKFGRYSGGYYPIAYDFERSADAYKTNEQKNALYKQYSTAAAHTDSGHTQTRVSTVARPVRLSLDVMFNHLENVIHDLEFRPAVIDANRFLEQPDTKAALTNALGIKGYAAIGDWLKSVASDQGESASLADKAFRWFRFNATFVTLGASLKPIVVHGPGNLFNFGWEAGPVRAFSAMKEFLISPKATMEFVESKSERMSQRSKIRDRDLMDMSKKWQGNESALRTYSFLTYRIADEGVAYPLWMDAYKRALPEHGEAKAVDIADDAVTRTLGSGSILDQVAVQRGSESSKILSMYFSWASMMFNRFWLAGKTAGLDYNRGNLGAVLASIAKITVCGWMGQALGEALWIGMAHNGPAGEDHKKEITAAFLKQPFAYIWGLRDLSGYVIDQALSNKKVTYRPSPLLDAAQSIIEPLGKGAQIAFSDSHHVDEHFGETVAKSAALTLGYPQQINKVMFNFYDWSQGQGEATWRDLLSRRSKK